MFQCRLCKQAISHARLVKDDFEIEELISKVLETHSKYDDYYIK